MAVGEARPVQAVGGARRALRLQPALCAPPGDLLLPQLHKLGLRLPDAPHAVEEASLGQRDREHHLASRARVARGRLAMRRGHPPEHGANERQRPQLQTAVAEIHRQRETSEGDCREQRLPPEVRGNRLRLPGSLAINEERQGVRGLARGVQVDQQANDAPRSHRRASLGPVQARQLPRLRHEVCAIAAKADTLRRAVAEEERGPAQREADTKLERHLRREFQDLHLEEVPPSLHACICSSSRKELGECPLRQRRQDAGRREEDIGRRIMTSKGHLALDAGHLRERLQVVDLELGGLLFHGNGLVILRLADKRNGCRFGGGLAVARAIFPITLCVHGIAGFLVDRHIVFELHLDFRLLHLLGRLHRHILVRHLCAPGPPPSPSSAQGSG
mmetsp:Transcript_117415/g.339464  ORF Transcript_117415/g.339464 Transcript_117415/m.339464 type:complete len:389 (-) Transcript_117415:52-1218(-)